MPSVEEARAELLGVLRTEAADGLYFGGGTVFVSTRDRVLVDDAIGVDGLGRPFTQRSFTNIYCAGKPLLAMTVGALVDQGALTFATRVGDVLERASSPLASIPVADLLSHSAGLWAPSGVGAVLGLDDPDDTVMGTGPHPGWTRGQVRYSEYPAWHLLAKIVEQLTGSDYRDAIGDLVLIPLELVDEFPLCRDAADVAALTDALAVNEAFDATLRYPLLLERTPTWLCRWSPAFGYVSRASGLGAFYRRIDQVLRGARADQWSVGSLTCLAAGPGYDEVLGRECAYSLGFMSDLATHLFSDRFGPRSVGHSGNVGMTAAALDIDRGVVVAFCLSGLSDGDTAVAWLRPRLMRLAFDVVDAS